MTDKAALYLSATAKLTELTKPLAALRGVTTPASNSPSRMGMQVAGPGSGTDGPPRSEALWVGTARTKKIEVIGDQNIQA